MIRHITSLLIVSLLVACDKQRNDNDPRVSNEIKPGTKRSSRPPRENSPNVEENLRESLMTAHKIEGSREREKAVAEVAWNALELDPELAREAFNQLTADGAERIRLIQHFAMRLAEDNPDEALKWANALGTEMETAAACCHIALVISDAESEYAATFLSESGIEGRGFNVVVVQVLQRWAAKAPPDAAAWVVGFPPGKLREAGIKTVVSQWVSKDAQAVFSWIGNLDDESIRDESARAMAETLSENPKNVREAWLQYADPEIRSAIEQQRP